MRRKRLALVQDIPEGATLKFLFRRQGKPVEGFLARFQGRLVAYENVCCHLPISLDYDDNLFFSRDGDHFVCQTHGALYDPLTGACVRGPCPGRKLSSLALEIEEGVVWLKIQ